MSWNLSWKAGKINYIYMGGREERPKAKKKKGGTTSELPMSSCLKGMRLETDFCCGIVLREETSCFINEHICTYWISQTTTQTQSQKKKRTCKQKRNTNIGGESNAKMKGTEDEHSPCHLYRRSQSFQEIVSSAPHIPDTVLVSYTLDLPNRTSEKSEGQ